MPVSLLALSAFAIGTTEFVIMGLLTARLLRKLSLVLLMVVFIIGNLLCAMAVSYNYLTLANVLGVPIGTWFGQCTAGVQRSDWAYYLPD